MADDVYPAFVHEGGHVLMASTQGIRCHGMFLKQVGAKACNLIDELPKGDLPSELLLYLAAGNAAEVIVFGEADPSGSNDDRRLFGKPPGTTFEEKIEEGKIILAKSKAVIETLASQLTKTFDYANGDFTGFRPIQVSTNGVITPHWELLDEQELKDAIQTIKRDAV
jgi:hypothetical protein